ncbi:SH3 domain-containing protein [Neorhizobium sp. BT27B]|uniref:SH3 domain-containing protein n=1 Tax=Neorhizobium sp. BT27B TaxID=3142625 RepID=UPI003D28BF09
MPDLPTLPERLYAASNVRLRSRPSSSGAIVSTVPAGSAVEATDAERGWRKVKVGTLEGWISSDFLSPTPPASPDIKPQKPAPIAPLVRQTKPSRSGEAAREPYVATCDCPYDLMRNGRKCGGRSAYSRPGGRSPQCYF